MKVIIMSVSIEYCCYCVIKPENKYAHFKNLGCAGHVAHMGEMRSVYRVLVRKPERQISL